MTDTTDNRSLALRMSDFIGTTKYMYHPLYAWMKYTDGVKFFCENAGNGAYWFLDIIGTELRKHAKDKPVFLSIVLIVYADGQAFIAVKNGEKSVWSKGIESTDCPAGRYDFYLQNNVFFLKSEY